MEPGQVWGDRVNPLDLRFAKILRFGRTRTNVGFDIYNVLNANPALSYNPAYSFNPAAATQAPWPRPQTILVPRFAKISAQIDF